MAESDRMIDEIVQGDADRAERIFLDRLAFRTAEVRHQNRLRAVLPEILDGRQALAHAGVVGDDDFAVALFDGHVEINPNKHAFPAHLQIADREFFHVRVL